MRKFIDYFSIRLIIFLASFIGLSFIAKKFYMAFLFAFAITFLASLIIDIIGRKKTAKNLLYSQFLQQAIIGGNDYVLDLVIDTLRITSYRHEANYLITNYGGQDVIIINSIKFGVVTPDEVLRHQQLCHSKNITECYLLSRIMDRRCLALARNLKEFNLHLITTKQLYHLALRRSKSSNKKLLEKRDNTPNITKVKFSDLFNILFSRRNCSRYLITACILAFMSIFTPLRTYYLVMSGVTVVLSALCLLPISDYNSPTKLGIFSKRTTEENDAFNQSLNRTFAEMSQTPPINTPLSANNNDDLEAQSSDNHDIDNSTESSLNKTATDTNTNMDNDNYNI